MPKKSFLSIIVPAYNEAGRIAPTLFDIDRYLSVADFSYEIIVVNDGSLDKTKEIVNKLAEGPIKKLKIIGYEKNRGKGEAVKLGMLSAKGEIRLFMDSDNSTKINEIEKFLPFFEKGFNVVIGSRTAKGSEIPIRQPLWKQISGKLGNLFTRILVIPRIRDTQCGFKAFSEKAAEDIFPRARIRSGIFDVEILAIAKLLEYRIKEIGVRWEDDPDSRFGIKSYLRSLLDTIKIRFNLWRGVYN